MSSAPERNTPEDQEWEDGSSGDEGSQSVKGVEKRKPHVKTLAGGGKDCSPPKNKTGSLGEQGYDRSKSTFLRSTTFWGWAGGVLVVLVGVGSVLWFQDELLTQWFFGRQVLSIEQQLEKLRTLVPPQSEDTWDFIQFGLERFENQTVLESEDNPPSVYLLMGEEQEVLDTLATNFALQVSQNVKTKHLHFSCEDASPENTILNFRESFKKSKVMLLTSLHKLPASVAQELHYFCDQENPLAHNSLIVMTLGAEGVGRPDHIKKWAAQRLTALWSDSLPPKILTPLISRLNNMVLDIKGTAQ